MDASRDAQVQRRPVIKVTGRSRVEEDDALAVERALSIRVDGRELAGFDLTVGVAPRWGVEGAGDLFSVGGEGCRAIRTAGDGRYRGERKRPVGSPGTEAR